ncbi:MAG: lysophospholipid acyltransferase family protein, partial [Sphaerochaetaceae bacterium]
MSRKPFFIHFIGLTYGSYLKIHYKIKTAGFENIPKEGPYLVLSNHTHLLDSFFISAVMDSHIRWIAGAYLFKNQILKILLTKLVGSIGKQQGRSDLTTISNVKEAFRKGENVGLFPEGTRTWDGEPLGFSVATAKFVRLFNVPVVLMNLEGNYALKPRWAQKARKGPFTIRVVDVLK